MGLRYSESDGGSRHLDRRAFLAGAAAGALGVCGGAARADKEQTVRDRLWLWCHAAGAHTRTREMYGLAGQSAITPEDAAAYMGLRNVLMVRHGEDLLPPTPECARAVAGMDRVVWSIEGGGGADVEPLLALQPQLPALCGVIMDDYFGRVPRKSMWLAENSVAFPVTLTLTFAQLQAVEKVEVTQSAWVTGDYLSKEVAIDTKVAGGEWTEAAKVTLPAAAGATETVGLGGTPLRSLRLRILSTHDTDKALSCGLSRVRVFAGGREVPAEAIGVEASSTYPGHPASHVLLDGADPNDPFSLESLRRLRDRLRSSARPLDIWVVLYTGEFGLPSLQSHLDLCDVVTMWTWTAAELANLEANFARFGEIVGPKRKVLGCYMWDYGAHQPMPVEAMQHQCERGLQWLREGRLEGMIFLASCICDLGLEAVEWTKRWLAGVRYGA